MKAANTSHFKPAYVTQIVTPQKYMLDALWFGSLQPKRVVVFLHGLASTAFNTKLATEWVDTDTAVMTFSNRGSANVSKLRRIANTKKGFKSYPGGMAHEVFTECVDDIQGAVNLAKAQGAKEIYLAGHSTGCQKSVLYASGKHLDSLVKGLILLAPMSDYADAYTFDKNNRLAKATAAARKMVEEGVKHELLPSALWSVPVDAQRFLSLHTPDSKEEIFCYAQKGRVPRTLNKVKLPMLAILAGADEYADRPMQEIVDWFAHHMQAGAHNEVYSVPDVLHSFRCAEKEVAQKVRVWLKNVEKRK